MRRHMTYSFEELPLVTDGDGFSGGLVNGEALIEYFPNGFWAISAIYLDGSRRKSQSEIDLARIANVPDFRCYEDKAIELEYETWIHATIRHRLYVEWRGVVSDAVNDEIEKDQLVEPAITEQEERFHGRSRGENGQERKVS